MPVGQAVTATRSACARRRATSGGRGGRPVRRRRGRRRLRAGRCCRCSPSCRARPARGGLGRGGGRSQDARTRSTTSSGVSASRSEVGEGRLDQRAGQLGEQLQVRAVAAGRRGDQEGDVGGAVLGAEVHRRAEPGEGERRLVHAGRAAVGDRDATGQAGGRGALAGEGVLDELVDVGGAAGSVDDLGQGPDDVVLVGAEVDVEAHQIGRDQVGHRHPPWVMVRSRTETSSGRTCEGCGMVVPGSPAAALP